MRICRIAIVLLCLPASVHAQTVLSPEKPFVIDNLAAGETKLYTFPVQSPASRHTITLQPLTGDPDLKVWLSEDTSQPPAAQSQQGPLLTDRVSLAPKDLTGKTLLTLGVTGASAAQYALSVTITPFHSASSEPSRGGALKVRAVDEFGDGNYLITDVNISNQSDTWYDVTLKASGDGLKKAQIPQRSVLGPKQIWRFPQLALTPEASLKISIDRTSRTALIYLTCDVTARLVNGGAGLPGTFAEDVQSLLPHLQPLAGVGTLFAKGEAMRGFTRLIGIAKNDPKTFTALHEFLKRSGLGVSQSVLSGKLLSGFGPISAIIQGVRTLQAPERETAEIQALTDTQ